MLEALSTIDESYNLSTMYISEYFDWEKFKQNFHPLSNSKTLDDSISLDSIPQWLIDTKNKLNEIGKLAKNWDGYGSPPLCTELYKNAVNFLFSLEDDKLPVPYTSPISGGGVQFEWHFSGRELEIEFMESQTIGFLKVHEDDSFEEGEFAPNQYDKARQLIHWLTTGK